MKKLYVMLGILDFVIGLFFGAVGHFYSLLCFPLVAIIRGYLGVNTGEKSMKHAITTTVLGAVLFFIGLLGGSYILLLRIPTESANELMTLAALNQAFLLSLITSFVYFLLYLMFGTLSAFLCKEIIIVRHLDKKDRDV